MKSYGQNNEDLIVYNYLIAIGIKQGSVLDIGANDGVTFSNSRLFSKLGWLTHLVEPSKKAIDRILKEYESDVNYTLWPYAIGNENKNNVTFFESGSLINKGDTSLVSTFSSDEMQRWPMMKYEEAKTDVITFEELTKYIGSTEFDFISIDAEGFDLSILKQIDFNKIRCRAVCVEWNSQNEALYWSHMIQFSFRLFHKNQENLIFVR